MQQKINNRLFYRGNREDYKTVEIKNKAFNQE